MGEEKKEEEKKKEEGEGKKEVEEKKDEEKKAEEAPPPPPPEIVLKVDMHCEACARKVARALKGFEGVEEVRADSKTSKVVVKGKAADPLKVWERLQKKSGRKVELISPLPKPPEEEKEAKVEEQQPPPKEDTKEPEKKDEPPPVVTVVLSIRMHCEACAQVLQKRIRKIPGVETVETDIVNGTVTVKGVVEPEKLAEHVYKKTRKHVSVVTKEEEKKKEEGSEEEKKKEEEEKKKEEEDKKKKEEGGGDQEQGKTEEELMQQINEHEIKRSEYWPSRSSYSELYAYPPPQMFSDENPNACSVM
ncbi:Heavy metal-associated isoprenylated plant protein 7 [Linum grandiflorum]